MNPPLHRHAPVSLDKLNPNLVRPPAQIENMDRNDFRGNYRVDGAFGGSFAGPARDLHPEEVPWYRQRSYFASGWTDPVVWRSAVRYISVHLHILGEGLMQVQGCRVRCHGVYVVYIGPVRCDPHGLWNTADSRICWYIQRNPSIQLHIRHGQCHGRTYEPDDHLYDRPLRPHPHLSR